MLSRRIAGVAHGDTLLPPDAMHFRTMTTSLSGSTGFVSTHATSG
jgi:hypothetical protein